MSGGLLAAETVDRLRALHPPVQRLSLSLSHADAKWLRDAAKEAGVPVSHVVELVIRERMAQDVEPR